MESIYRPAATGCNILALCCTVSAISLAAPPAARAQQANATAPQTNSNDVVVTAQRRAERLQDVPQSVQAISGVDLVKAGVVDTRDLYLVTSGLRMDAVGTNIQPAIRGVSQNQASPTAENNVATYVDGVYQANELNGVYQLPDIRDIEVLKGPQGSIYGRNATGGAILINTFSPDLSKVTGMVSVGYSSFNTDLIKGYVSAPIVQDKLAVSLAALFGQTDGWRRNLLPNAEGGGSGDRNNLLRLKIRFDPWEGADFVFTAFHSHDDDKTDRKAFYLGNSSYKNIPGILIASQPNTYAMDTGQLNSVNATEFSLRGNIAVGPGTLTTTTAYNRWTSFSLYDADYTPLPVGNYGLPTSFKTFSQELVYSTKQLGRFHGTGGLFYFTSDGGNRPFSVNIPGNFVALWTSDKDQSYAAFAEGTFDVTDRLSITGGIRYSYEKKDAFVAATIMHTEPALPFFASDHWDALTPHASILYKLSRDTNIYFTFSQGFKSGLFNTVEFQKAPVNPEHITAYEVGVKSEPTSNLSLSAAAFYYDYSNLQVTSVTDVNRVVTNLLSNAAKAQIYGLEFDGSWRPTDAFRLSFAASYLHAVYSSFPAASIDVPNPVPNLNAGLYPSCVGMTTGNCTILGDVSGKTMIRSPAFSGNITAQYTWRTGVGPVDLSGTAFYSSKVYYDFSNRVSQPGYEDLNASLAWRPYDKGLQIRLWCNNLTNKVVISEFVEAGSGDLVTYTAPRSVGVEMSYRF